MRRVLLTVHKFFPEHRAGTEVLTLKVAQELKARGYETLVVTADPPDQDARHAQGEDFADFNYEGIDVHVVREPLRLRGYTFRHEYDHPQIADHVAEMIRKFKPDLVHIFHAQNLSADLVYKAKEQNLPVVASLTDFWFVCPVVQLKRPDGKLCRGPEKFAANCLTCYTPALFPPKNQIAEAIARKIPAAGRALGQLPAALRKGALSIASGAYVASKLPSAIAATVQRPAFLRDCANMIDAIMVPTNLMKEIFVENGIDEARLLKVPFGLDTEPLERYQTKSESAEIRIGFIGTIFEHKGLDLLLSAFHLLPQLLPQRLPKQASAVLKIYGDPQQFPEYGEKMLALAQAGANASRIEFLGTFPNAQLGEILQNLDVLVVPSRWYENTPLVIQSAFATRTPVMATDLGGMSELVNHDVNGLLFKVNDVPSLQAQLLRIIEDKDLLPFLRQNIKPERTVQQMVDEIEQVYERVLNRKTSEPSGGASHSSAAMLS